MVTFSAARDEAAVTAKVQVLIRANDPLYDLMLPLYGHRAEDKIWTRTLGALGAHFGSFGEPTVERLCVDRRRNWSQAKNIWQNAAMRSSLYMARPPIRWVRRRTPRARPGRRSTSPPMTPTAPRP